MEKGPYQKLAHYLDKLPGGFGPSDTGADLRLLRLLFSAEEAELAIHLSLDREEAITIAERAVLPLADVEKRLDEMAHKGLIFSTHPEIGPNLYQAVPFVVGIYEFQINNLSENFLQALDDYWKTRKRGPRPETIPQMRTIPVGESIEPQLEALPYEQVSELVKDHDRFAVAPCICRRTSKMAGDGCDAPEESCLVFGDWADYYVRDGRGRAIDQSEVMEILVRADAANLVLQPSNSKDVSAICCCCGCCCGILGGIQRHPRPAEYVASSFIAQFDSELCIGCWTCLDRCQMEALNEDGDRVSFDAIRCIGCGLCVTTCPSEALTLTRKPDSKLTLPPDTIDETWRVIAKAQSDME